MKQIILKSLKICQFQKFDYKYVEFGMNQTDISGDNGVGKTTIYSAFTWLLFGKDSQGREKFDIKHLVDGKKQDKVDTSVEGHFVVKDDQKEEELVLIRVLSEKWNEKTNVYVGDETKCYINSVPKLVGEYQNFIASLISENEFRMLTSVTYFLSLKKEEQREYLCRMAGVRTAQDIAQGNKEWENVIHSIPANMTLEDYQKTVKDSLKTLKADNKTIQPSINALTASMPEELDYAFYETQKDNLNSQIENINSAISSKEELDTETTRKRISIRKQISDIEIRIADIESKKEQNIRASINAEKNRLNKLNEARNIKEEELCKAKRNLSNLQLERDNLKAKVDKIDIVLTETFNRYEAESRKEFEDSDILYCPLIKNLVCNSNEANEKFAAERQKLREDFNTKKVAVLEEIQIEGKRQNKLFKQYKEDLQNIEQQIQDIQASIPQLEVQIADIPLVSTIVIDAPDKDKIEQDAEIAKNGLLREKVTLTESLEALTSEDVSNTNIDNLKEQRRSLMNELEAVIKKMATKEQRERVQAQIDKLHRQGVELSDEIINFENILVTLTEIQRAVIDDASKRINAMFQVTQWVTVVQQKNGEYKDVCEATIDGVSLSLNTAARINVGLDICSAISHYLGVFVPCFIESRESVNEIVDMSGIQIVNLRVAPKGTPLTIKIQ